MVYFWKINSSLVWDASLLVIVNSRHCLDMIVGKIENGLERGFVKHRLNCLLITDPKYLRGGGVLLGPFGLGVRLCSSNLDPMADQFYM